jgi:hypothetical protein
MQHLTPEALAALVDDTPDEAQASHLAVCQTCAAELDALREQTGALGRLPELRPPQGDWEVLEARLISEGLVRRRRLPGSLASTPPWMRAVAAVVLFLAGTGVGTILPQGGGASLPAPGSAAAVGALAVPATSVSSIDEAAELIRVTERRYIDAILQYRQLKQLRGDADAAVDPEQRYVALEYLLAAAQPAVEEVPADPFLNGLLASLMAEREAARSEVVRQAAEWH